MNELLESVALLNERAVARLLGCGIAVLHKWRKAGTGPRFLKLNGLVRYEPQAIQEFIDSRRRSSTSE
jgi:predicted DNA-binding transcriptional regulator AlpA